jgi:hypothetical protein
MKKLTIDEAEKLAMETDYAVFACEPEGNEINKADAAAFFLEGYEYAVKLFNESHLPHVSGSCLHNYVNKTYTNGTHLVCVKCGQTL